MNQPSATGAHDVPLEGVSHSQLGEDKIIGRLLARIGIEKGFFVELGAWDGKFLSNTFALYEKGWSGCYIEGDQAKMRRLRKNCPDVRAIKICAFVAPAGEHCLDAILAKHGAPPVDVLSVDIGGDDYEPERKIRLPPIPILQQHIIGISRADFEGG